MSLWKTIKKKRSKIFLVVLAAVQLSLCILALILPDIIVGKISREDAEDFLEGVHDELDNFVTKPSLVNANIGFFESFINKTFNISNREGMVGIFAFSLLATLSSCFTLVYSIQMLFGCAENCTKCCKYISEKLKKMAKTNYSSGVSSVAVAAMTGFSVADLQGGNLGTNFYLQIVGGLCSGAIHMAKTGVKANVERDAGEQARGTAEMDERQQRRV